MNLHQSNSRISNWKAPLLVVLMGMFFLETLSGFALFFAMGMFSGLKPLGIFHSALGLILIPVYVIYQIRHFLRVKNQRATFHYRLGVATALSLLVVILSGLPILPGVGTTVFPEKMLSLVHVVSSFAFLICLAGHLVIVWRVTFGKIGSLY